MSSVIEDLIRKREEKAEIKGNVETVKSMLEDGFSIEKALKYVKIDRQTYEKYAANER